MKLSMEGIVENGKVLEGVCERLFGGEYDSLSWVTFTPGPLQKRFESPLLPMGRAATLVRYGNKVVSVWLTQEDGSLRPVAAYNGMKNSFIPNSGTEFASVIAEAKLKSNPLILDTIKFPKIVIGFSNEDVPDVDVMDQDALQAASGQTDPGKILLWFENHKRYAGDYTFIRWDLFPANYEVGQENPVFEDFTGLIDSEGYPKSQIVYQDCLVKYGMQYKNVKNILE